MSTRILNLPSLPKWWNNKLTIILITLISVFLHTWSVWQLPLDYDEPVYLSAASDYASFIRTGNLEGIIHYGENREHPALVKLLYSIPYLVFPNAENPQIYLFIARGISALFGVLSVYLLSKINIWSGLLFAFHSMTLKYTSQAYLESLPMFAMIAAIYFLAYQKESRKNYIFSAFFIGVIAASKYPYLVIVPIIFYLFYVDQKRKWQEITIFLLVVLISSFLLNPMLWENPINYLVQNYQFHTQYSQSVHVQNSGYPWYQPILFLASSVPWHPDVFFFVSSDELMFIIAILGLYFEFRDNKWKFFWFVFGVFTLLIWPTKWPQYTLLVSPVLAIISGDMIKRGIDWVRPKNDYWNYLEEMLPQPPKLTWFLLIGFIGALTIGKIAYEYSMALSRQGWESFTTENSPLSSNVINAVTTDGRGVILFGTDQGVEVWHPTHERLWGEKQERYTFENSQIQSNRILSVFYDEIRDIFWLGTEEGISYLSGEELFAIEETNGYCLSCKVNDIFVDDNDQVWFTTNQGIIFFDGVNWNSFSDYQDVDFENPLEIFVGKVSGKNYILVGTLEGISIFDVEKQLWETINWAGSFFGWGGVKEIIQSQQGIIFVATAGGGINFWDGETWGYYRNTNTVLKSNTILSLSLNHSGELWAGLGYSTEPGGFMMKLDKDQNWGRFAVNNSGYLGGEPLSITVDQSGRLWIATNGNGIQTYLKSK